MNIVRAGPAGRPPVVLIHAVGIDLTYWGEQFEHLTRRHEVITYDLPGHGHSSASTTDVTFDLLASVLTDVIAYTTSGPVHLVGLSVGGMIAQTMAVQRPDLVCSLSLIATTSTFTPEVRDTLRQRARMVREKGMSAVVPQTLERWFTPAFAAARPDVLDRVAKTLLSSDPDVHGAMWDMIASLDVRPQLAGIRCPTQVIVGEQDPTTPPAAARSIAMEIAGATLHVVPDTSHMIGLEAPGVVAERLCNFISSVSGNDGRIAS